MELQSTKCHSEECAAQNIITVSTNGFEDQKEYFHAKITNKKNRNSSI